MNVASAQPWNERHFCSTTRAFAEWRTADCDLRAFYTLSLKWMNERFDAKWDEIGALPGDPDGPEQIDVYEREVGINSYVYDWMLGGAVVRDAVTAFEVYLEKVAGEILAHQDREWKAWAKGRSPAYFDVVEALRSELNVDIDTEAVKNIRDLRHILAHQRGELRTEARREKYGQHKWAPGTLLWQAELSQVTVTQILDDLAEIVRRVDPLAFHVV